MPAGLLPAWTLNNHDAQRAVTRFGRADAEIHGSEIESVLDSSHARSTPSPARGGSCGGPVRARAAGMRVLYAGEELGLPEVLDLPDEARQDPVFVRSGGAELGAMAAVSSAMDRRRQHVVRVLAARARRIPWLPQPREWARWNAAGQEADRARCSRSTVERSQSGGRRLT